MDDVSCAPRSVGGVATAGWDGTEEDALAVVEDLAVRAAENASRDSWLDGGWRTRTTSAEADPRSVGADAARTATGSVRSVTALLRLPHHGRAPRAPATRFWNYFSGPRLLSVSLKSHSARKSFERWHACGVAARRPKGVDDRTLHELRPLLDRGEVILYAFQAQANLNARTLLLDTLTRGTTGITGEVFVVVTDKSVLVVNTRPRWWWRPQPKHVIVRLPHPHRFGPVFGEGWIVLGGHTLFVPGAKRTIAKAEAVLAPQ